MSREARHAEQHEADVLSQPTAQGEQQLLPLAVLGAEPIRRPGLAQLPDQADGAGKQLRLSHDVIAIHPGAEPLKQRPPDGPLQVLGQVELAPVADADSQERVPHEVHGRALERVGEPREGHEQDRPGPPPAAVDQPVQEMEVQVDESDVVADPVERPTEPGRGAA